MSRFEYVMSGLSFTAHDGVEDINQTTEIFKERINSRFAVLYNAFTEKKEIKKLIGANCNIYADSGGLQIVSRKMSVTPKIKDDVYKNQTTLSNFGMCFDELPVKRVSEFGHAKTASSKMFDIDNYVERAKETGLNIKRQIEVFEENPNNVSTPVLIVHGNCMETMLEQNRIVFDTLGSKSDYIKSVAVSTVAIGPGQLEELERSFVFKEIQREYGIKHLHLLGVGSVERVLPFALAKYDEDTMISYDSTSHAMSSSQGLYYNLYGKAKTTTKLKTGFHPYEWSLIEKFMRDFDGVERDPREIFDHIYVSIKERSPEERIKVLNTRQVYAASQAFYVARDIENAAKDRESALNEFDQSMRPLLSTLHEDFTAEDFIKQKKQYSAYIVSDRVKTLGSSSSLESLFG